MALLDKMAPILTPLWQKLNQAQRGYLLATSCLVLWLITLCSQQWLLWAMTLCLLSAVLLDMWQGFSRIWHTLPGKAGIIVFYVILANFCFALAESHVNNLIGVRTDIVPYSVNLAVLLLAPIWSFVLSFAVLIIYVVLHSIKIILLLMLRPLGVRSRHLLGNENYPVLSLVARLCYLPVILGLMVAVPEAYISGDSSKVTHLFDEGTSKNNQETTKFPAAPEAVSPQTAPAENEAKGLSFAALPTIPWLEHTVARFLYQVESMGRSSCVLNEPEHLVHINDYEVLVITTDTKAAAGYHYQVRLCGSVGYRQPAPAVTQPVVSGN